MSRLTDEWVKAIKDELLARQKAEIARKEREARQNKRERGG